MSTKKFTTIASLTLFIPSVIFIILEARATSIHSAVYNQNNDLISKYFAEDPGCMHQKDKLGLTPLHYAIYWKKHESLKHLISLGADIEEPWNDRTNQYEQLTPFLHAAAYGNVIALDILVRAGANTHKRDMSGRKAIEIARYYHHDDVVAYLARLSR
jgi:ankyrin repeat protein